MTRATSDHSVRVLPSADVVCLFFDLFSMNLPHKEQTCGNSQSAAHLNILPVAMQPQARKIQSTTCKTVRLYHTSNFAAMPAGVSARHAIPCMNHVYPRDFFDRCALHAEMRCLETLQILGQSALVPAWPLETATASLCSCGLPVVC